MEDPRTISVRNTPVARNSDEWTRLEYLLQLSLRSTGAKVTSIASVAAPHLTVQFEARTAGQLVLDSWVDTRHLGELNTLADVCSRGFRFPPSGMIFPTGMVVLPPGNASRSYEVLLCKVGVGRYLPIEESQLLRRPPLPEGYQTYYLHKPERSGGGGGSVEGSDPSAYYHEFLLLDPAQVLPCYVVQFEISPDDGIPLCDVCNERPAAVYCSADNARLCVECDTEMHAANKLVARHARVPLRDAPPTATCAEHNTNAEYFCNTCATVVCVHCKMVGSHSSGEASTHRLTALGDAYRAARTMAQREDALLEARKQSVAAQLRAIDDRLRAVRANSAAVEEAIYQALQDALTQLQALTQQKLTALLGDELELRRQLQQIEWVESFAANASATLTASRFLALWRAHAALRSDLQHALPARAAQDVAADLQLRGSVMVTAGDTVLGTLAMTDTAAPPGAPLQPLHPLSHPPALPAPLPAGYAVPGAPYPQPVVLGAPQLFGPPPPQPQQQMMQPQPPQPQPQPQSQPQQPAFRFRDAVLGDDSPLRWRPAPSLGAAPFLGSEGTDGSPYIRTGGRY